MGLTAQSLIVPHVYALVLGLLPLRVQNMHVWLNSYVILQSAVCACIIACSRSCVSLCLLGLDREPFCLAQAFLNFHELILKVSSQCFCNLTFG